MRQFLLYAVLRLGLWIALWWVLTLVGVGVMLAGVLAALIAMLLSILFLDRLRDAAAMRWKAVHERRVEKRGDEVDEDAEYEDGLFADDVRIVEEEGTSSQRTTGAGPAELPPLGDDPAEQDRRNGGGDDRA